MLGSIIGNIIGSAYEFDNAHSYDFDPFPSESDFTYDTVLTIAVADAIRKAIWFGSDSDTLACITGGITEAFHKEMPDEWVKKAISVPDKNLSEIVSGFLRVFNL
jgi:ADP-ribosylglycohydrolase